METGAEICNGIVNRLGIFAFRTSMIFTVLRYFEAGKITAEPIPEETLLCSDDDLKTILELVEWVESTALEVLDRLPQTQLKSISVEKDSKKGHTEEQKKKALELKQKGRTYSEIAEILLGDAGLKGTIYKWLS